MTQQNFGAQVCAYAPSDEKSRCKGSSRSRMEKARDDPSMAIGESQDKKKKVHFATLMDVCHVKNAE